MPLNYSDSGNGQVIVLIHGFCESLRLWDSIQAELSRFARVISVDLPGFGASRLEQSEVSMEFFGDQVMDLLNELGISNFSVVGHSLGGYVALAILERYQSRVDALVMFHSTAYPDSQDKKQNRDKMAGFISRNGVATFMDSFVGSLVAQPNREKCKTQIETLTLDGKTADQQAVLLTIEAMKNRPDRTNVLAQYGGRVLWIIGQDDVAVPLADGLKQAEIGNRTEALVLKNCGHLGMIEKPTTTLTRLIEFFA